MTRSYTQVSLFLKLYVNLLISKLLANKSITVFRHSGIRPRVTHGWLRPDCVITDWSTRPSQTQDVAENTMGIHPRCRQSTHSQIIVLYSNFVLILRMHLNADWGEVRCWIFYASCLVCRRVAVGSRGVVPYLFRAPRCSVIGGIVL